MRNNWLIGLALFALLIPASARAQATPTPTATPTYAEVAATPQMTAIPRIGLNLGNMTSYGPAQFQQNILVNPGFEPIGEGRIIIVAASPAPTSTAFSDNTSQFNATNGYYTGDAFVVLSGVSIGDSGTFTGYNPNGGGNPTFSCSSCPTLAAGDVVSFYHTDAPVAGSIPGDGINWATSDTNFILTNSDHEPGSAGSYSLQATLNGSAHNLISYFDSSGASVNLLPVNGNWTFSVWLKSVSASSPTVTVNFLRFGSPTIEFIHGQTCTVTSSWSQCTINFSATDAPLTSTGTLELELTYNGTSGTILSDDAVLESTSGTAGWRPELISVLQKLNPQILRDSNGQLGESFTQRTIGDTGHGPSSFNGPNPGIPQWTYGLNDFFALCHAVGASPEIIMPDTFTPAEIASFGAYLHSTVQPLYSFPAIYVELGNENWNGLFRGAGIVDATHYGLVATNDFNLLKTADSNDSTIKPVAGGQYGNPDQVRQIAANVANAPYIASAPYFYFCENTGLSANTVAQAMFENGYIIPGNFMDPIVADIQAQGNGQSSVAYEEGLSTLGGSALTADRLSTVAAYMSGGSYMELFINVMTAGYYWQLGYQLAQLAQPAQSGYYDVPGPGPSATPCAAPTANQSSPLWGMVHDLSAGSELIRPSGLAEEMANLVIMGDFYPVNTNFYANVVCAAFKKSGVWSAMCSNGNSSPQTVYMQFPSGTLPGSAQVLQYTSTIEDNNESVANVFITATAMATATAGVVGVTIPAWGAADFLPAPTATATATSTATATATPTATATATATPTATPTAGVLFVNSTGATSDTCNVPSGVVAGNILIWSFYVANTTNAEPNAGSWTAVNPNSGGTANSRPSVWYHIATNSEPSSYTSSTSVSQPTCIISAYSGENQSSPIEATIGLNTGSSSPGVGATQTPTNTGDALVTTMTNSGGAFAGDIPTISNPTAGTNMNLRQNLSGSNVPLILYDGLSLTGGVATGTQSATIASGGTWSAINFIIAAAPVATPTPTATATATATATSTATATATATSTATATATSTATATPTATSTPTGHGFL